MKPQNKKEPHANEIAMLLANMAKDDSLQRVLELKRDVPKELFESMRLDGATEWGTL